MTRVAEPVTVEASAETKEELGVVVWGAEGHDGSLHVAGYGSDGRVAYVLEQRTIMISETRHAFATTLTGREETSSIRL